MPVSLLYNNYIATKPIVIHPIIGCLLIVIHPIIGCLLTPLFLMFLMVIRSSAVNFNID